MVPNYAVKWKRKSLDENQGISGNADRNHGMMNYQNWECPPKYALGHFIGKGGYGTVMAITNNSMKESEAKYFAVKGVNVSALFEAKACLREISYIPQLNHQNVINLVDAIIPIDPKSFKNVFYIMPRMDCALNHILPNNLNTVTRSFITFQILQGVQHIHQAGLMHRDLKPSNILLVGFYLVKICDFGMATTIYCDLEKEEKSLDIDMKQDPEPRFTELITTRFYRSPEVYISPGKYNQAVDVWAIGCIMAEMIINRPLFCGKSDSDQIHTIVGTATDSDGKWIDDCFKGENDIKEKEFHIQEKDLIAKFLVVNPKQRSTVSFGLQHNLFSGFTKEVYPNMQMKQIKYVLNENMQMKQIKRCIFAELTKLRFSCEI